MAVLFDITTAISTAELDPATRKAEAAFTVTNRSGQPIRGRALAKAAKPTAQPWLTVADDAERSFPVGGVQPYKVIIQVPLNAPGGDYLFQLDMIDVTNPDETYTNGPAVRFVVPAAEIERRKFPWWIVAAAIAAIVVIGAIIFFATRPRQTAPNWPALRVEAGKIVLLTPLNDSRLETVINQYRTIYPPVDVEHVVVPAPEYLNVLLTMIASGSAPDVVWATNDVLSNVPESEWVDLAPALAIVEWTPDVVRDGPGGIIFAVGTWGALNSTCCVGGASALAMFIAYEYDNVR